MTGRRVASQNRRAETALSPLLGLRGILAPQSAEKNLRLNTIALMLSSVLVGALGLLFWVVTARLFPPRQVGIASALITSAVMLSTLSVVSLDAMYERFLPVAGSRAGALLRHGYVLTASLAIVMAVAFIACAPSELLLDSGWSMAGYLTFVLVLAVFTLQDKASAGLGVARWAAAKNAFHSLAKLIAVATLAWTGLAAAIVVAWGATAAASALWLMIALHRRSLSEPRFRVAPNLPPRRELWSYFGSSFGLTALWAIGPLVVPLIVVAQIGVEANAYFAVTWSMVSALYLVVHLVVSPFVAESAAHPDQVAVLSRRMIRTVVLVSAVGAAGLALVGPVMLGVIGAQYRAHGAGLLYLAAVFVPLSAPGAAYEGLARVHRKLKLALAMGFVSTALIVVGSLLATRAVGVVGVGWAYLVAESLAAVVLIGPLIRWLTDSVDESESP